MGVTKRNANYTEWSRKNAESLMFRQKMIAEFPVRQWKCHMLFDLLRIIESTCFAIRLSGSDRRRSE